MRIHISPSSTPPGKLADVEIHFPKLTDSDRAHLETVAAITYGPAQDAARALQAAARVALAFDGLKLAGFAVWERRTGGGRNVTFPARQYSVNGERRTFALLRPAVDMVGQERIRDLVLEAFTHYENEHDGGARFEGAQNAGLDL